MPCEYRSRIVWEQFTDLDNLEKSLAKLDPETRRLLIVDGLTVRTESTGALNKLKQRYQTEKTKTEMRRKGYTVTEKKQGNKIKLQLRR